MIAVETERKQAELRRRLEESLRRKIVLSNQVVWTYTIAAIGGLSRRQLERIGEVLAERKEEPTTLRALFAEAGKGGDFPTLPKDKLFDYVGVTYDLPAEEIEIPPAEGKTGVIAAFSVADILGGKMRPLTGDFYTLAGLPGKIEIKYQLDPTTGARQEVFLPTHSARHYHDGIQPLFESAFLPILRSANCMIVTDKRGMKLAPLPSALDH